MADSPDELKALEAHVAALTARFYQVERMGGFSAEPKPQPTPPTQPRPLVPAIGTLQPSYSQPDAGSHPPKTAAPSPKPFTQSKVNLQSAPTKQDAGLEKTIGQFWLNRIGIVALLVGVSYFLKYAFENNWIGPAGRIAIGLLAGIGLIIWSEKFRSRGHAAFSYSLKAVGIGTLYLSLWGAFQVYHLIPSAAAFAAMVIVTASTLALSLSQDAELLASFALIGGFATPVLLSTGQNHEVVLFSYVCLLDAAILVAAIVKPWRRLLWGSFAGTIILYLGWYS